MTATEYVEIMGLPTLRFNKGSMHETLRAQLAKALDAVQSIPPDKVLSTPVPDLVDELFDVYVVNPIELHQDQRSSDGASDIGMSFDGYSGRTVNVPGTRVAIRIPFDGDKVLFDIQPSTHTFNPPRFDLHNGHVVVAHEGRSPLDPDQVKRGIADQISTIEKYLDWQRSEIQPWNDRLRNELAGAVEIRRDKVLADRALDEFLEVPIAGRANASPTFAVDPPRRPAPKIAEVKQTSSGFKPEPAITEEGFGAILDELASVTTAVERLPSTFVGMPEESLRDVILVVLNNRFGPATGETFSRNGKTDILVPYEGDHRAVFIAECKKWKGPKALGEAIDQLLGYVTWRDTKAALVLFVNSGQPTEVEAKAVLALREHAAFKRTQVMAGREVFTFANGDDVNREVHIALLVIPVLP
jgi:hypothetical protein